MDPNELIKNAVHEQEMKEATDEAAKGLFSMYTSLVDAGFSELMAFNLIASTLKGGMR